MIVSAKARVAGVMGWPVGHSLSPRLHGFWLQHYGLDGAYIPLPVQPDSIEQALRALPKLGFSGVNLTIPHKETSMKVFDKVDDLASRIGAASVVVVHEDGSLEGRNADGYGFIENLKAGAPGWNPAAGPAVMFGSGGAARAVIVALVDAGVPSIRLANRTRSRAQGLADEFGPNIEVIDWDKRSEALDGAALLVNTTSLGMSGQPPLEISLDALPKGAVVTDIVYSPLMTDLLTAAEARGHVVVDGLGMLLHQGKLGFDAFFGHFPEVTQELRDFVLAGRGK
jgi:shikimate dehydrogenase